jgi:Ran GTPase-activating protein (RanGAP) involved in mRNA processing and transport
LKELLAIPSLEEFSIYGNEIGRNGLDFICEFLKNNSTLLKLNISGKISKPTL